ncbi:complex I subunit 4 family protein [Micromonospora sp. NBC_01813]|uniref:complex I subunit 4 family protein n=1 Tax=Micromonospora sp. NBC_01813 TaxID=2975988 RepID=UPI002DD85F81|nr:NADH-quinone oxidoreductase subunit M [Micromonospora sp. NBC_01813]WSA12844.1 NADH-quinone oxidoreductase subunit M [Micromonospora sp. NBC_01813]
MTLGQLALLAVLVLPALGALLLALPVGGDRAGRIVGTGFAALAFLASLPLIGDPAGAGWFTYGPESGPPGVVPWHQIDLPWVPALDLRFHLGVDGISYPLVLLTTALTLLCCGYTIWRAPHSGSDSGDSGRGGSGRSGRALIALLLVIEVGIVGTFLALDLVLFFVFFEVVLLPMYAIIAGWGGSGDRAADGSDRADSSPADSAHRRAATKFAIYTLAGSVLLLVGVVTVVTAAGTADLTILTGGGESGGGELTRGTQLAAFTLLALAFAIKAPLWPLHTWLPDAHSQAPTVGSVILAGVLLKMGTYGLIRVAVGVAPEGARWAAPVLGTLAVVAIIVGSLVCLAQTELKRLIAYSSVGHMGFVLLGIATLSATGIQAALIGNIAHGVITGLLFFLASAIKDRFHTGELAALGGLREQSPALAGLLGYAAIASLGLPGLAGFWGEAFAVVAALQRGGVLWTTLAVLAAVGAALTAAYLLRMLRRVVHGPPGPAVRATPAGPITRPEALAWAPLIVATLAIGLLPVLVLGVAEVPVQSLLEVIR